MDMYSPLEGYFLLADTSRYAFNVDKMVFVCQNRACWLFFCIAMARAKTEWTF